MASYDNVHNMTPPSSPEENDESMKKETGEGGGSPSETPRKGRRKIKIQFIDDKSRRHITFSKRKAGIMKKAYELSTLTGTQVLLLVASETGHVYTFATPKLQPLITKPEGKNLIQSCLNAPEIIPSPPTLLPPAGSRANYGETAAIMYTSSNEAMFPEHPPASYEKEDKEHRTSRSSQESGKGYHVDVSSLHQLTTYNNGSFQSSSSASSSVMGPPHPLSMGTMGGGGYGSSSLPSRYVPHPSSASSGGPGVSQYTSSFSSPTVANMMAQFPSPGFGHTNPGYMWAHSSTTSSNAGQHSESSSSKTNDSAHHNNDAHHQTKD